MILGHERQIRYFDRVIAADRLAHAYLLHGPERVGKRAIASAIARSLLCSNFKKDSASIADAGDDCSVCRQIDAGVHQDVVMVSIDHPLVPPKEKETRSGISIDDIRELKRRFAYAPVQDAWRIAIIDEVATMSKDAEVAFLKLLEEPGARTLFLLIAESRDAVPATIVSRATPLLFALVPDRALTPYVRAHLPKENFDDILAMARGRAGLIVAWAQDSKRLAEDKKNAAFFSKSFAGGMVDMLALSEKAAESEAMRYDGRDAWIGYLRRRLAAATASERRDAAGHIARALDLAAVMEDTNVNPRLCLDVMFSEGMVPARATKKPW